MNFKAFICILLITSLHNTVLWGQSYQKNYVFYRNFSTPSNTITDFKLKQKATIDTLSVSRAKIKKIAKKHLNEWVKELTEFKKDELLMETDSLSLYLNALAVDIAKKNPKLVNRNIKVIVLRTNEPNACDYGEGLIMFHLDFLCKISCEAALRFVLCHEMAHDINYDPVYSLKASSDVEASREYRRAINKSSHKKYNSIQETANVNRRFVAKIMKYSRTIELRADSLGFVLLQNCGNTLQQAHDQLLELDSLDNFIYQKAIDYNRYLSFEKHPFKKEWLENNDNWVDIGGNIKNVFKRPDSLKTHPDCPLRAEHLQSHAIVLQNNTASVSPSLFPFQQMQAMARFEMLRYLIEDNQIGMALYNALQLSEQYPNNSFLKCIIVECLYEIHIAQKNHHFFGLVEMPNHLQPKSYNEFLLFLHNVNFSALQNMLQDFYTNNQFDTNDQYYKYNTILMHSIDKTTDDYPSLVQEATQIISDNYLKNKLITRFTIK